MKNLKINKRGFFSFTPIIIISIILLSLIGLIISSFDNWFYRFICFVIIVLSVNFFLDFFEKRRNNKKYAIKKELTEFILTIETKENLLDLFKIIENNKFFINRDIKHCISLYKIKDLLQIEIFIDYHNSVYSSIKYKEEYNNDIIKIYDKEKLFLLDNIDLNTKILNAIKLTLIDDSSTTSSFIDNLKEDSNLTEFIVQNSNSCYIDFYWDIARLSLEIIQNLLPDKLDENLEKNIFKINDDTEELMIEELIKLIHNINCEEKINKFIKKEKEENN